MTLNTTLASTHLDELKSALSADRVLTDSTSLQHYGRDWTRHFDIRPSAIVFPVEADEVVRLVKWARKNHVGLVPSGGRTGLSGGACATNGEVVVSFERMNRILDYNELDRTVRVQPGVVTEALQNFAKANDAYYPVDFAARGSSHIGGNIATNAGGVKVLRYGLTRDWIAGLTVVTGAGELIDLNKGLVKNATGFDLRHLFIGSEGALGFVVEALVRLTSPPKPLTVMILGLSDLDSVMKVFNRFRTQLPLTAFEFFSDVALRTVVAHTHLPKPLGTDCPNYLLIEVENTDASTEASILESFEHCLEAGWVLDGAIAQSEAQSRDFWRLREDISEASAPFTPYKNDVSVTVAKVPEFLAKTDAVLKKGYPDFQVVWFGHIGDGNMHINILKPNGMDRIDFLKRCKGVNADLFKIIAELGGSVSAEHGVGLVKKDDLSNTRSAAEIQIMRQLKSVFDPDGIMNPGKML
ncbi:MAG: FAD-binding oxidoreductase [Deltaproteobacteria bacterium]|nr:FAD-binding oxidoreductase [Deltaproteobacteria bacterium]